MQVFWVFVMLGLVVPIFGYCFYFVGDYAHLSEKYLVACFLVLCVIYSGIASGLGWWRANRLLGVLSLLWGVVGLCFVPNLVMDLPLRLKGQVYYTEGYPEVLEVVRQSDYNYSYRGRVGGVELRLDEAFLPHRWYRVEYMPHSKIIVYVNHFDPPKYRE